MLNTLSRLYRHPYVKVAAVIFVWFFVVLILMTVSVKKLAYNTGIITPPFPAITLLKATMHWDSGYYLSIAQNGYPATPKADIAFFPLYPLAIRWLAVLVGKLSTAAAIINLVTTIAAGIALFRIATTLWKDTTVAWRAVFIFLVFPSAYFLAGAYSEAIFCGLSFWAFSCLLKKEWMAACILAGLASAARLPGLLVSAAVIILYTQSLPRNIMTIPKVILATFISCAGFLAYMLFLTHAYGSPFVLHSVYAQYWPDRQVQINLLSTFWFWIHSIIHTYQLGQTTNAVNLALPVICWFVAALILIKGWRELPPILSFYTLACLILFALTRTPDSMNRYILAVFPIYLILAKKILRNEERYGLWLVSSALLCGILLAAFATNFWTG